MCSALGRTLLRVLSTYHEMIHAWNALHWHAKRFVANDEFAAIHTESILHCLLAHTILKMFHVFSLRVLVGQYVASTHSSLVVPPIARSPRTAPDTPTTPRGLSSYL